MRAKECEREWKWDRKKEREWERERKSRNIEEEIERAGCVWYSDWRCERGKRMIVREIRDGDASSPWWEQEKDGNTRARKKKREEDYSTAKFHINKNRIHIGGFEGTWQFRSYFLRGPWFSFFRLHLYNRDVLRCNEELHIFKHNFDRRARAQRRLRKHEEKHIIHQYTQRGHYTAYTYIRTMEHTR